MFAVRLTPPVSLALLLAALSPAHAAPKPNTKSEARAPDPKTLLRIDVKKAGTLEPLPGSARPYAEAKNLLARGKPVEALKALSASGTRLLADREALLRGDALLAISDFAGAKLAYEQALTAAQLASIATSAARGLVNVLGQLGEHDRQLEMIDALLTRKRVPRRSSLLLERAALLHQLGKSDEAAKAAFELTIDDPRSAAAKGAITLLRTLSKVRVEVPKASPKDELRLIRNLIAARAYSDAEKLMEDLGKRYPALSRSIETRRAEMYERQRNRADEMKVLAKLYEGALGSDDGPDVLFRLGRLAMSTDDDTKAIAYFDELEKKFPRARQSIEGQYLAGWIPYNRGNYAESTRRMLEFAAKHKKTRKRDEALWYAGWAAYLGGDGGVSRRAFTQLIEEHPSSVLASHARYWMGRVREKEDAVDLAKAEYRQVLSMAPLSYYGFWAMARLEALGEKTVLNPPPTMPAPASLKDGIARLGASRPIGVDRAVVLHAAGLMEETLQELRGVASAFRRVKDTEGRVVVADMLANLGAHHLAFRLGARIASTGADLATGEMYAWRAFRHAYPKAFDKSVKSAGTEHEVEDAMIWSIMRTESHFRPFVKSPVGARGLMQLMPNTAKHIGQRSPKGRAHAARYQDPDSNIWLGSWYFKQLMGRYSGELAAAIGAYNAGPSAMDQWMGSFSGMELDEFVERIPYRETRRYVRRVYETYMIYRHLEGLPLPGLVSTLQAKTAPEGSVAF